MEWEENRDVILEKRLIPAYETTNILRLQNFLWDKLQIWANNSSCVQDIWKHFTDIVFESINRFVPHKILKKNHNPECYNKEVKRLNAKVRIAYNRRKLGERYQAELTRLSKKLLTAKKMLRKHSCVQDYRM